MLREWDDLPDNMKNDEIQKYYEILSTKKNDLKIKRAFDVTLALIMLVLLSPIFLVISILIVLDSPGGVFYRQVRITSYGQEFKIHKFRTMVTDADKIGSLVTVDKDRRVTKIGRFLRKYRLDELPQLLDIIAGDMSYVGTRPEIPQYVTHYTSEMMATLLLPAGITSEASIRYKDEAELLEKETDIDKIYIEKILPAKMEFNLNSVRRFSFIGEIATMFRTVFAILGKEYR